MNNILLSALLGYLTDFFGIGIGALCAFLICAIRRKYIKNKNEVIKKNVLFSFIFEFSSGLMMAVATFRLIPDAINKCGTFMTLFGIVSGLLFVWLVEKLFNIDNPSFKTSLMMLINLWLHNIPEGFVLGNTAMTDLAVALLFFGAVIIHNIPQGFLIALPIAESGIKKRTLVNLSLFSGIPTALGAVFGAFTGETAPLFSGFMLSFAAGSMLYVLTFELSYEARKMCGRKIIETAYIIGLILGIIIL